MEDETTLPTESDLLQVTNPTEAAAASGEESPKSATGADGHGGGVAVAAGFASGGDDGSFRVKRKRGRPRKDMSLAEDPVEARQELIVAAEFSAIPHKRGRGRPRGSGKWQTLAASLGGGVGDTTAGADFTPCIISIQEGENIVERIWSFSQRIPESVCILSASGTVSVAEIQIPASRCRLVRYEGQFSIIHLNGSHTYDGKSGGKICALSIQLVSPEGRFFGGAVAGSLIAGGPTQLIIATFRQKLRQQQPVNIIRPQNVQTPKLSKGPTVMVTVPTQAQHTKPLEAEAKDEQADFAAGINQLVDEDCSEGPNVGHVSSSPPSWRSVPPKGGSGSEFVGSPGFDTEVID